MQIGAVPLALVEEGRQQALDPQSSQPPHHTFAPSLFHQSLVTTCLDFVGPLDFQNLDGAQGAQDWHSTIQYNPEQYSG